MNKHKIAILADSCTDVPKELIQKYGIYVVPLKVIYRDAEYDDGVTITAQEVYDRFEQEIPKTSLPSAEVIAEKFRQIKADGYEKVVAIAISSGLSGTYNVMKLIASEQEDLEIEVYDTKNIAIGSGYTVIRAAQCLEEDMSFEELKAELDYSIANTKLFFCVATLEYLQKGGRIGLVTSILGTALNLKPIISCNDDGIYYTIAKVRGRNQSLSKALDLAEKYAQGSERYSLAIVHGNAKEEAEELKNRLIETLPKSKFFVEGQVSPALVVHTGPGAIGICVQRLK